MSDIHLKSVGFERANKFDIWMSVPIAAASICLIAVAVFVGSELSREGLLLAALLFGFLAFLASLMTVVINYGQLRQVDRFGSANQNLLRCWVAVFLVGTILGLLVMAFAITGLGNLS